MADLYIVDFGGGEQERARREAEREVEHRRLADRYTRYLAASAGVGEAEARRVITALVDARDGDGDGNECQCFCHPRLSAEHGDGFRLSVHLEQGPSRCRGGCLAGMVGRP